MRIQRFHESNLNVNLSNPRLQPSILQMGNLRPQKFESFSQGNINSLTWGQDLHLEFRCPGSPRQLVFINTS